MNALIEKIENEFRVSHRVVAEQTDNQEKSILDLVTRNKNHFEDFGQLRFKIATVENSVGANNEQKTYYLNEQQATFLMTLLRNSPVVVKFKKTLVKAFYELKERVVVPNQNLEKTLEDLNNYKEKYFELLERENELLREMLCSNNNNSNLIEKPDNYCTSYSKEEIAKIKELNKQGYSIRQIAKIINRSKTGVCSHVKRIKNA